MELPRTFKSINSSPEIPSSALKCSFKVVLSVNAFIPADFFFILQVASAKLNPLTLRLNMQVDIIASCIYATIQFQRLVYNALGMHPAILPSSLPRSATEFHIATECHILNCSICKRECARNERIGQRIGQRVGEREKPFYH